MKKALLLYLFFSFSCLFLSTDVYAQATIKGNVTDNNQQAVVGVNIVLESSGAGTVSDVNGNYELKNVPVGENVISFSFVGFKSETRIVQVEASSGVIQLDLLMEEDAEMMEEFVVVGYGTQRKRELVGNVEKLVSKDIREVNVGGGFEAALQGKAPGVQITSGSGAAGGHAVVRIRGTSSISAGGDPLYVIDGIPLSNDAFILGERGGLNNNPLSSINPDDIESIDVLKDAAAAAIYGSRGANGVIIITTKKGKTGKPSINFSTKYGISRPTRVLDVLNTDQWLQIQQEAWENSGNVGRFELPNGLSYEDIEGIDTDWIDKVIQTGFQQEQNLSFNGGNRFIKAYLGGTYSNSESFLRGNNFERYSGRVNLDITPIKRLQFSISSSVSRGLRDKSEQAWSGGLGWAQSTALPIYPVYKNDFNPAGSAYSEEQEYYNLYGNPIAQLELTDLKTREIRFLNNLRLSYRPVDRLTLAVQGNYDFSDIGDYRFEDEMWTTTTDISKAWLFNIRNFSSTGTAEWQAVANNKHKLTILAGTEYQNYDRETLYLEANFLDRHFYEYDEFRDFIDTLAYNGEESYQFFSLFGRLNYSLKDKYFAQVVFRRDASSKFGSNNRWGNFPSVGLGYIVSEEDFWFLPKVNYFKLKASFGITGNSNIPWTEQYATFDFNQNPGLFDSGLSYNGGDTEVQRKFSNPDLKWEVVRTIDVGADIGVWQDRLTASIAYYHKITSDALLQEFMSASSGLEELQLYRNVGRIRNQGIEFQISTKNISQLNFTWSTDFNISANRNMVLDVGNATPDALDGGFGDTRVLEGYPLGVNYIVPFSHVDPESGRPVYLDRDGNETFTYSPATMRQVTGDIHPDFIGSLTNNFRLKNFDLGFMFYYSIGGQIYDDAAKRHLGVVTPDWNMRPEMFDRWQQDGDVSEYPRLVNSMTEWGGSGNEWQNNHTLWLYDASFVRLRYVQLGYNIPFRNSKVFDNVRLYGRANNVLTFTRFPGWDPEIARDRVNDQERNVGGTSVTYLTPPQEKSFYVGANFRF